MDPVKREEVAMEESGEGMEVEVEVDVEEKGGRVRWERFLPQASVRVLVVEADDSTREIVAALLRKCGYGVTAVSDGLKAWEILKEKGQNIDLVLTEVELPSLPGFDLLTMITEHEICKNIPVIMISSCDYISMVFKCMLKGAADFLIKPIRKNELRNLWQHVWRRYASNGVSGGPNGSQGVNVAQQKSQADSENDAASNHSGGFSAFVEKNRECSEKGSETQSSCTRTFKDAKTTYFENGHGINEVQLKSKSVENDLRVHGGIKCNFLKEVSLMRDGEALGCSATSEIDRQNTWAIRSPLEIANLLGTMDKPQCTYSLETESTFRDNNSKDSKISVHAEDPLFNLSSTPELELTLRSQEPSTCVASANNGRNILNHSNSSPFSRYYSKTILPTHTASTNVRVESLSKSWQPPVDCSLDYPCASQLKDAMLNANGDETSSTVTTSSSQVGKAVQVQHPGIAPYAVPTNAYNNGCASFGSSLEPMVPKELGAPPWIIGSSTQQAMLANFVNQLGVEVVSSEQSHQFNNQTAKIQNRPGKKETMQAVESDGDLNHFSSVVDDGSGSTCNNSRSQLDSASRSTCSEFNENLTVESANSIPTGRSDGFHTFDGTNLTHMQRSIQREAALAKFRLKRKERCYEKKVRYQSRKKLAEQRPRIKGQFVRQVQPCPQITKSDGYQLSQ